MSVTHARITRHRAGIAQSSHRFRNDAGRAMITTTCQ